MTPISLVARLLSLLCFWGEDDTAVVMTFPLNAFHSAHRLWYILSSCSVHSPPSDAACWILGLGLKTIAMTSAVAVVVTLRHLFKSKPWSWQDVCQLVDLSFYASYSPLHPSTGALEWKWAASVGKPWTPCQLLRRLPPQGPFSMWILHSSACDVCTSKWKSPGWQCCLT